MALMARNLGNQYNILIIMSVRLLVFGEYYGKISAGFW
jgi:hypothetical protein